MRHVLIALVLLSATFDARAESPTPKTAASPAEEVVAADEVAPARFDGRSAKAFAESRAAFEAGMGDAARLAFHTQLVEARSALAKQRGRPLSDAEFAAALDGKTLAELDALADSAPLQITIDIETSDDT